MGKALVWAAAGLAAEAFLRACWRLVFDDLPKAVGPALLTVAWITVVAALTRSPKRATVDT